MDWSAASDGAPLDPETSGVDMHPASISAPSAPATNIFRITSTPHVQWLQYRSAARLAPLGRTACEPKYDLDLHFSGETQH
jgi:hypothetical protein